MHVTACHTRTQHLAAERLQQHATISRAASVLLVLVDSDVCLQGSMQANAMNDDGNILRQKVSSLMPILAIHCLLSCIKTGV